MSLELTYSGLLYFDRTLALLTGDVRPAGIDLNYVVTEHPGNLFRIQCRYAPFEVAEMSASTYIAMVARDDRLFVALPVFVSRNFRHGQVYVHGSAPIQRPQDLAGARVGVFEYEMTAALWIRGFLQHDFGVHPQQMHWFTGGLADPEWAERRSDALTGAPRMSNGFLSIRPWNHCSQPAISTRWSPYKRRVNFPPRSTGIRRLFPDFRAIEREYYART